MRLSCAIFLPGPNLSPVLSQISPALDALSGGTCDSLLRSTARSRHRSASGARPRGSDAAVRFFGLASRQSTKFAKYFQRCSFRPLWRRLRVQVHSYRIYGLITPLRGQGLPHRMGRCSETGAALWNYLCGIRRYAPSNGSVAYAAHGRLAKVSLFVPRASARDATERSTASTLRGAARRKGWRCQPPAAFRYPDILFLS